MKLPPNFIAWEGAWRLAAIVTVACLLLACGDGFRIPREPTKVFGRRGSGPGRFEKPRAVAVSPVDSTLVVIDRAGRVQVFDAEAAFLREWRMPDIEKGTPTGCSIDRRNRLLVADTHYHRIMIYDLKGELLDRFGSYGDAPGQMIYPTDVVCDAEGNYYVSEYGELDMDRVMKFSPAGEFLKQWGDHGSAPGEFLRPMSLAIGGERLYVADSCNHRIQVFDFEGRRLNVFGEMGDEVGQFKYPYDIAVDAHGEVYVCEYGNHRVQRFSAEGRPLSAWGGYGREPGLFCAPWGVAVDPRGTLVVVDTMNFRLQIF